MRRIRTHLRSVLTFLLTLEAKAIVAKYRPKIILVAGGVGKTLAKDAAFAALSEAFFVRSGEQSGVFGASLAVVGVPNPQGSPFLWVKSLLEGVFLITLRAPYPEWLVIETTAERPGTIARMRWLKPSAVIAVRFPAVPPHVEFYPSPEAAIAEALTPARWLAAGGAFVANEDDENAKHAGVAEGVRRMTFGLGETADIQMEKLRTNVRGGMPSGISFDVLTSGERSRVSLAGVAGTQHIYPVLAGVAAALAEGVLLEKAAAGFGRYAPRAGRMRLIPGMRGTMIIDDSYTSSPAAAEEALSALADIPRGGKRVAVLADMLELGALSVGEHARIGGIAASSSDVLMTVGVRARGIAEGARAAGMPPERVLECENGADAAAKLLPIIAEGDVILVKGSQAMRMERVVKSLMAEPGKARELLVRQSREWLRRA